MRHFDREMNLQVTVLKDIHLFYDIHEPDGLVIPGIRFLCLCQDRKPESKNHSEIKWVNENELAHISSADFIPGLKEEFLTLIEKYKSSNK